MMQPIGPLMRRVSVAGAFAATAIAIALVAVAAAASIRPSHNPANDPRLLHKPIEDYRYDYAKRCRSAARIPKGMIALERWLERNVRGESWGIHNCHKLPSGHWSLHSENRAIDWHLDKAVPRDRRAALNLIHTLLATDKRGNYAALARRMGVQGFIFNCHDWWSGTSGIGRYSYCYRPNGHLRRHLDYTLAHRDHIHIELSWPGARKRTSFWRYAGRNAAGGAAGG
jgi:hypothetical protein